MAADQVSEVPDLIEVREVLFGGFAVRGPWVTRAVLKDSLKIIVMVRGQSQLVGDGFERPTELGPGDAVVLNNRSWVEMRGGRGDERPRLIVPERDDLAAGLIGADSGVDDIVIGGHASFNAVGEALLLEALPPVGHLRSTADPVVRVCRNWPSPPQCREPLSPNASGRSPGCHPSRISTACGCSSRAGPYGQRRPRRIVGIRPGLNLRERLQHRVQAGGRRVASAVSVPDDRRRGRSSGAAGTDLLELKPLKPPPRPMKGLST